MKHIPSLLLVALLLCGCSKIGVGGQTVLPAPETEAPTAAVTTEAPTEAAAEATPAGKEITAMAGYLNPENLGDCTAAVGFTEKDDAYMDGSKFVIRMDLYDYELFDLVDIQTMEVGDTIYLNGEPVVVESLKEHGGERLINGGNDQDGYTLRSGDGGYFFLVSTNDQHCYRKVGEAIVPVAQEFTMTDSSDPGVGEQTILPGDLITRAPDNDAVYTPYNTTATIIDGYVMNITVAYMP